MNFAEPRMLWATLALLPALIAFLWWAWRQKQQLVTQFVQARLLANLTVGLSKARQQARLVLLAAAVASLMLALARPQWGHAWEEAKQRGLDIVVAIDTSRSMLAADIAPNRLARAKLAALDLLRQAKSDRLGLVAFAGTAFLQCPLTLDEEAFRQSVNALDAGIIPQGGSALVEAITSALTAFNTEGDNHKILVLFTDGEDHESGAVEAAKEAAKSGMRIFTVGIGTAEGELLRQVDDKGKSDFIRDEEGNVVKSRLNENLLREIATVANGFYLPLRGANTLDVLYERGLAPLPKADLSTKFIQRFHERFQWPLGLGIVLLVMEMFLPDRRGKVHNSKSKVQSSQSLARAGAAALALALLTPNSFGSPAGALRKFEKGDFDAARQEFERLIERHPDDARLHYNAGAAAYRSGEFEDAAKEFGAALRAQDMQLQQQAYYNLGNSLFRLGEPLAKPEEKIETWEKAAQSFESAAKLNPQDADAKYNLDVVRKKLEELKQQQQQQQQSPKNDEDKKDEKEKQDQQKQDQQKKDDQKQSDQEKQQQQQKSQPQQDSDKQKQEAAEKKKQDDQKKEKSKSAKDQKDKGDDQKGEAAQQQAAALGQMTMQQAKQLLDAQKGEVRALIFKPADDAAKARNRLRKDW